METIHIELSAERDSDKLYDFTENPFAMLAARLVRMLDEGQDRDRQKQYGTERTRAMVERQYSLAVISPTKVPLTLAYFIPLSIPYPVFSCCLQNRPLHPVI